MIMENKKEIELRSGKVRSIIGRMPGYYLRYGTITVIAVLAVLTAILSGIKSENRITLDIKLLASPQSHIYFSRNGCSVQDFLPSGSIIAKEDTLCLTIFYSCIIAEIPSSTTISLHPGDTLDLIFDSGETHVASIVTKTYCQKAPAPAPVLTLLLTPVSPSSLSGIRNPTITEISTGKQSILSKIFT